MRTRNAAALAAAILALAGAGVGYAVTGGHADQARAAQSDLPAVSTPRPPVLPSLAPTGTAATAAGVSRMLGRAARDPALGARLAGYVVDAATGSALYRQGDREPVPPASTVKLLTSSAALLALGPGFRLSTSAVRVGSTVYLVGGGDVTLTAGGGGSTGPGTASLTRLARATAAALGPGARVRLRLDTSAWTGPSAAPGWSPRYLRDGDVARLAPLELDEGRQAPGTGPAPRAGDPAAAVGDRFAAMLRADRVRVRGQVRRSVVPGAATTLASVQSAPVSQLVQELLTSSDNDLAEALGRAVALHDGQPASFHGEAAAVTGRVVGLGVASSDLRLNDASGLSRLDRVTPRALVQVLQADLSPARPQLAPVVQGLPVAGFTGTLAPRYRTPPASHAAGLLRAKTGTLRGVNALAGFVVDRDDRVLLFAFVADQAPGPSETEAALDRLAARLAGCGCTR